MKRFSMIAVLLVLSFPLAVFAQDHEVAHDMNRYGLRPALLAF